MRLAEDRADKSQRTSSAASTKAEATLAEIRDRLSENTARIEESNVSTKGLAGILRLQWLRDLGTELKSTLQKIFFFNVQTYRAVLDIHARLPVKAEREMSRLQEPMEFEDARGRIFPIHFQLIESWKTFDAVLESKFEGIPGYQNVKHKAYVLQDRITNKDVNRQIEFCNAFLPGQRVDMSVIFRDLFDSLNLRPSSCPGCQALTDTSFQGKDTTW